MLDYILEWIFPPACMACRQLIPLTDRRRISLKLCEHCLDLFEPLKPPVCNLCGGPVKTGIPVCSYCKNRKFYFEYNRASYLYDELMRDLIHEIKFRNRKNYAAALGRLWAEACKADDFGDVFCLVPIPLHKTKERERGFNQAEVLGKPLSEYFDVPMITGLLTRTRHTLPQSGLSPRGRMENVAGVFQINPKYKIDGKKIVLIDDIYTTGASLNEAAKILMEHGAGQIICMTLTVALKKKHKTDDNQIEKKSNERAD
jgi:ComF family protein